MAARRSSERRIMPGAQAWNPYAYALPSLLVLAVMVVYPLVYGIYLGFTNMSLKNFFNWHTIGFTNFVSILQEPEFYQILWRSVLWTASNVVFTVAIGMWLAILLNRKLPGKGIFRTLLILPWAIPQYIAALSWKTMYQYDFGFINLMLQKFSLPKIAWLQNPTWAFVAVVIVNIWLGVPFMMMICLGGLQAIPSDLYEAADVDGGTGWDKFSRITLPMLRPVLVPAITLSVVWTFNLVNVIYLVTGGGPGRSTDILVSYVYKQAVDFYRYGYAAAYSVIIFVILLVWALLFIWRTRGDEEVA